MRSLSLGVKNSSVEAGVRRRRGCWVCVHAEASADASPARRGAGRLCDQPSTPAAGALAKQDDEAPVTS